MAPRDLVNLWGIFLREWPKLHYIILVSVAAVKAVLHAIMPNTVCQGDFGAAAVPWRAWACSDARGIRQTPLT
jgi:hypothetical protein